MSVFVGRNNELELLDGEVRPGHMLAIVGPSGVGKTTLAAAWSRRRDDARFIECRERLPVDVANEIAATETLHEETDAWLLAARRLNDDGVEVLVLDDVSSDFGDLRILRNNWDGCVVTTSHTPLEGGDVATLAVGGFEVPRGEDPKQTDAYELFVQTARTVDVRFALDSRAEVDAFLELVARFDGYPLALAIAARRAATLSVREVLRLVDQHATLTQRTSTERHRSMQAALAVSIDQVESSNLALLYAMSLFRRPVRTTMLATLLDAPIDSVLEALEQLVRAGLVTTSAFPRPLELVAKFVRSSAPQRVPDEVEAIETRALDAAFASAVEAVSKGSDHDHFGEAPSLWTWVVMRPDAAELPRRELAYVLAAVQVWLQLLTEVPQSIKQRIRELVAEVDHYVSWLEYGRMHVDIAEGLDAFDRAFAASQSDEERFTSKLRAANKLAYFHRFEDARRCLAEALEFGEHNRETRVLDASISKFGPDAESPEATRLALEAIETELAEVKSHRRRSSLARSAASIAVDAESVSYARLAVEEARLAGSPRTLAYAQIGYADVALSIASGEFDREMLRDTSSILMGIGDFALAALAISIEVLFMVVEGHSAKAVKRLEEAVEAAVKAAGEGRSAFEKMTVFNATEALVRAVAGQHEKAMSALSRGEAESHDFAAMLAMLTRVVIAAELQDELDELIAHASEQNPGHATLYEAVCAIAAATANEIDDSVLAALEGLSLTREERLYAFYPAVLTTWAARASGQGLRRALLLEDVDAELVIASDFSAIRVDGSWTSFVDNPTSRALLRALALAGQPLDFDAIGAAIYPDETLTYDALQNRVNVAVSRLRKVGLKRFVVKRPEGFVLEGHRHLEQ